MEKKPNFVIENLSKFSLMQKLLFLKRIIKTKDWRNNIFAIDKTVNKTKDLRYKHIKCRKENKRP